MAINSALERRAFERKFFLAVAILFPLTVLIGFGPTYYLKPLFSAPPLASILLHVHGALMTSWVFLFITQVYLISSKKVRVHQKLGLASIVLVALIVVVAFMAGIDAAARGQSPAGIPPLSFLIIPLGDAVTFGAIFGAAVYYRKSPADHKRLILLTIINMLPPAIARFPFGMTEAYGPLWFYGVPDVLVVGLVAIDSRRNRKVNWVFAGGAAFMIACHWLRLPLSTTPAWLNFASWITGVGG